MTRETDMDFSRVILAEKDKIKRLYMLTAESLDCRRGLKWGQNVTWSASGENLIYPPRYLSLEEFASLTKSKELRTPTWNKWLLAYTNPVLAVILNPVHDDVQHPVVWECEGDVSFLLADNRAYCKKLTARRILSTPTISSYSRQQIGMACVSKVYQDDKFISWVTDWKDCHDRGAETAKRMALHFSKQGPEAHPAELICYAAAVWNDHKFRNQCERLIAYWTAQAISEAVCIAKTNNVKDFDLMSLIEITMAAK